MLGHELQFLAEVADLARLDFDAAAVTLQKLDGRLVSRYRGAYSSGQRWLDLEDAPDIHVAVSAMQFKSLVALFTDEEEVEVTLREKVLRLRSAVKTVDLNTRPDLEAVEAYDPEPGMEYIEAPLAVLLNEVECATEFSARSMAKPILTGLKISSITGKMGIQSSDGISALFQTVIDVSSTAKMDMVAPGYDLVLGLKLLSSGMVKVVRTQEPNNIILYGDQAIFRSAILAGEWPDFAKVRADREGQRVTLDTSLIRSLVQSVRILGTSNDLRLRGDGEYVYLETMEGEVGAFQAKVPSEVKGSYLFDVNSFLLAMNLGSKLDFKLPLEANAPTLVTSGERKFWMTGRYEA